MEINLIIWGLSLDIVGVFILALVATIDHPHHRRHEENRWLKKRYWWLGWWSPIYRDTKTLKLKINWTRKMIKYGAIPPKTLWNIFGVLCIVEGFLFQIYFYLA